MVHGRLELVIDVNDESDVEMHATQVDCKNAVTEATCSIYVVFGCAKIQWNLKSLVGEIHIDNAGKHNTGPL